MKLSIRRRLNNCDFLYLSRAGMRFDLLQTQQSPVSLDSIAQSVHEAAHAIALGPVLACCCMDRALDIQYMQEGRKGKDCLYQILVVLRSGADPASSLVRLKHHRATEAIDSVDAQCNLYYYSK